MGGSNDPTNLLEVTVEEHAELHLALYLEHGKREDWIAFHMLAGKTTDKEWARRESARAYMSRRVVSEETKKKISESKKGQSPWIAGKNHREESIQKMKDTEQNRQYRRIKCLELDKVWDNAHLAEQELNIPKKQIKKSANPGPNKTAKGLTFVWLDPPMKCHRNNKRS